MISYLQWRVKMQRNEKIFLNFLMVGHTKFAPDRHFGLIKLEYSKSDIDTFPELLDCVQRSSRSGHNKKVDASQVIWYSWDSFFSIYFRNLKGITKFHHFLIDAGGLRCKELADSVAEEHVTEKEEFELEMLPSVIKAPGLSLERKSYLFRKVRGLCVNPDNGDVVGPNPDPKLKITPHVKKTGTKRKMKAESKGPPQKIDNKTDGTEGKRRRGRPPKNSEESKEKLAAGNRRGCGRPPKKSEGSNEKLAAGNRRGRGRPPKKI